MLQQWNIHRFSYALLTLFLRVEIGSFRLVFLLVDMTKQNAMAGGYIPRIVVVILLLNLLHGTFMQGAAAFTLNNKRETRRSDPQLIPRVGEASCSPFNNHHEAPFLLYGRSSLSSTKWNEHNDGQEAAAVRDQPCHVSVAADGRLPEVEISNETALGLKDDDDLLLSGQQQTSSGVRNPSCSPIPNHIAFVCDGNARWARQHHLPVAAGHAAGADRLVKLIESLSEMDGVDYATFYAFSTENWKRSDSEIHHIFTLMERTAHSMLMKCEVSSSVAVRIIGDIQDPRIPASLRSALFKLEKATSSQNDSLNKSDSLTVSIAVNYSARNDMVQAVRAISKEGLTPGDITQEEIRKHLSTRDIPDPDLIVRTSGENRLSNWLLWEAAYAEFYVSQVHWPDFDANALKDALESYSLRQRRYGGRVDSET